MILNVPSDQPALHKVSKIILRDITYDLEIWKKGTLYISRNMLTEKMANPDEKSAVDAYSLLLPL